MNLKCLICSDLFTAHAEIYGTTCGHLFHYHCLLQWIDRSKTCPQCRTKSTEKTIHRVFLSVEENVESVDLDVLHNKLDNLQFQLRIKDKDVKTTHENYQNAAKQNIGLREEVKNLEGKMKILESAMHALKEQVIYFKSKSKENTKREEEVLALRNKIKDYSQMKLILDGNQEELNDMMRNNQDVHSLSILVVTLKKQLLDTEKNKTQLQSTTKNLNSENHSYRKKLRSLKEQHEKMLKEVEAHKNCIKEREFLKQTIIELQTQKDGSSAEANRIDRIITESPIPASRLLEPNKSSPSVPDMVTLIKDANSPYLRVQTSSIGLSGLVDYNKGSNDLGSNKISIFKQPSLRVETLKRPRSVGTYDGLGGHSKEEHLPSLKHEIAPKKLRCSSAISLKFKKRAGLQQKFNF